MPTITKLLSKKLVIAIIIVAILAAAGVGVMAKNGSQKTEGTKIPLFTVESGPLLISVTESGTIKAQEQVILKSELEGRSMILYLIPEATKVKEGDVLVELDATSMEDQKIKQDITVQRADASFIKATKDLEVGRNQAQSDIEIAELTLKFAIQDLAKYIDGEYPNLLKEAKTKITINKEEEERAADKFVWSQKLAKDKYISDIELKTDKLTWEKAKLGTELAESDLNLLENYTYKRQIDQLESDKKQAKMALERVKLKADADIIQFKAQLKAAESVLIQEKYIFEKLEKQISKAIILAPSDGLVVYATSAKASWHRSEEPLDVGQEVHEHEELIYLPTANSVKSEISIHEASLNKVELGMPAEITVDALPGKVFYGKVEKIAVLPNAQMVFINPDLKVYPTDVFLEGDTRELRTSMSCKTEIIVAEYEDVKYVPIHAVVKIGDQATVYVMKKGKMTPRAVEAGMDNNRMIHIISGLEVGEQVVLTPPLSDGEVTRPKRNGGKRNGGAKPAGNEGRTGKPAGRPTGKKPVGKPKDMNAATNTGKGGKP